MTNTSAAAMREHHQQLAERLPLRLVLPADFGGVADRQLQRRAACLDLGDRAAEVAVLRGAPSRAPSVAGSRAAARSGRSARRRVRDRAERHQSCRRPRESACAASCCGSNRYASGSRTRTGMRRSSSRKSVGTSPSQRVRELLATPARRSARSGRPPPDRSPTSTSGLPRCTPTTSTTPVTFLEHLLDRLGELGQRVGIVAEDLHLDRRRRALEIAEHVLQQLDELDLDERRRLLQLRRAGR